MANHEVICVKRKQSNMDRLDSVANKICWIGNSVEEIQDICQNKKMDIVLNLACNYGKNVKSESDLLEANFVFPTKVLESVVHNGTARFLTIDTGLPDYFNMYSFSKHLLADYGRFICENRPISFYNLQLQMFYGADEPLDRFLPKMVYDMIMGNEISTTIGTQRRDIIAVDDVVNAILLVMDSELRGYNDIPVGTGVAPSVCEIVDYIWDNTGRKSSVRKGVIPLRKDEPDCIADVSLLTSMGEWKPIDWKTGMKNMIIDIKKMYHVS